MEDDSETQSVHEPELTVISVIPHEQPPEWKPESSHMYKYLVTAHSTISFLTHNYGIVYCLDMSPSLSAVVSAFITVMNFLKILVFVHSAFCLASFLSIKVKSCCVGVSAFAHMNACPLFNITDI
jgi:hypothetical protein